MYIHRALPPSPASAAGSAGSLSQRGFSEFSAGDDWAQRGLTARGLSGGPSKGSAGSANVVTGVVALRAHPRPRRDLCGLCARGDLCGLCARGDLCTCGTQEPTTLTVTSFEEPQSPRRARRAPAAWQTTRRARRLRGLAEGPSEPAEGSQRDRRGLTEIFGERGDWGCRVRLTFRCLSGMHHGP
jgi:hypothetical protein